MGVFRRRWGKGALRVEPQRHRMLASLFLPKGGENCVKPQIVPGSPAAPHPWSSPAEARLEGAWTQSEPGAVCI